MKLGTWLKAFSGRHCSNHNYGHGKTLLLRKYLGMVAFNNVTRLMLEKRFLNEDGGTDDQGQEFIKIVNDLIKLGIAPFSVQFLRWLGWIFRFTNKAFIKELTHRDRFVRALIEEHKVCQKKEHFVDELLTLQEKHEIDEDTMIGLFWDMVNAGMDTPGSIGPKSESKTQRTRGTRPSNRIGSCND